MLDDNEYNAPESNGVVTCDMEVWMQDRIRTAINMTLAIEQERGVGADSRQAEDAVDGIINGTALEIINHLNLMTEGKNLDWKNKRDSNLIADMAEDEDA